MRFARILRLISPLVIAGALAAIAQFASPLGAAADISMTIPPVSQQSGPWGPAPLGTSPTDTIASSGCAITAVTMMLAYYGVATDPGAFNAWLTANGGYVFDDALMWGATNAYSGGTVVFTGWEGPDLGLIHGELDAGRPVVAEVRLDGNQHFVLIVGYTKQGGLLINDPWFGDQVRFADRYGDPATGIVSIRTFDYVDPTASPSGWRTKHDGA